MKTAVIGAKRREEWARGAKTNRAQLLIAIVVLIARPFFNPGFVSDLKSCCSLPLSSLCLHSYELEVDSKFSRGCRYMNTFEDEEKRVSHFQGTVNGYFD